MLEEALGRGPICHTFSCSKESQPCATDSAETSSQPVLSNNQIQLNSKPCRNIYPRSFKFGACAPDREPKGPCLLCEHHYYVKYCSLRPDYYYLKHLVYTNGMPTSCTCKLQTLDICLTFGTTTDHLPQEGRCSSRAGHWRSKRKHQVDLSTEDKQESSYTAQAQLSKMQINSCQATSLQNTKAAMPGHLKQLLRL